MSDPRRWSEGGEDSELARELVLAGQSRRMPESERRAVWAGIALGLPAHTPTPDLGAAAPGAAGSVLSAYLTKGAIFLATLGAVGIGALQLWPSHEPPFKSAPSSSAPRAPVAVQPDPQPLSSVTTAEVTAPPAVAPSSAKPRVGAESQLREESLAVLEARSALRSGDAARCLALLEQARVRFPRGGLGQEREALTIEALAKTGQSAVARRRAEAFLRAHPKSPYVADVRRIAER
jgi:hypothetical protein